MKTDVLRLGPGQSASEALERVCALLDTGQVVLIPTDTVYGLAVDATSASALNQLIALKQRPAAKPFALLLPEVAFAWEAHLTSAGDDLRMLAETLLPGPYTLLVARDTTCPLAPAFCTPKLGIRVPADDFSSTLAAAFGRPIALTSANTTAQPEPADEASLLAVWTGRIPLVILAAPPGPFGPASTIIDLTVHPPHVVRRGAADLCTLSSLLGEFSLPEDFS